MASTPAQPPTILDALATEFSQFQPYRQYASVCSYCRRPGNKARVAYGMNCGRLCVCDYEHMLENAFLRSGKHVYTPDNTRSCCPNIPIRLDAMNFAPTRQHLRVLHRMQEFLTGKRPIVLPHTLPHTATHTAAHTLPHTGSPASAAPAMPGAAAAASTSASVAAGVPTAPVLDADIGTTTDVLEALLRLAERGRVQEAAEAICRFRADGLADEEDEEDDADDEPMEAFQDEKPGAHSAGAAARRAEPDAGIAEAQLWCAHVRERVWPRLVAWLDGFARTHALSSEGARELEHRIKIEPASRGGAAGPANTARAASGVTLHAGMAGVKKPRRDDSLQVQNAGSMWRCSCNAAFVCAAAMHAPQRRTSRGSEVDGGPATQSKSARREAQAQLIEEQQALAARICETLNCGLTDDAINPPLHAEATGNGFIQLTLDVSSPAAAAIRSRAHAGAPEPPLNESSAAPRDASPLEWAPDPATGLPRLRSGKVLDCTNAHTPAERRILRAYYRSVQVAREVIGKKQFRSDPEIPKLRDDEDGMNTENDDTDESDADTNAQEGATEAAPPAPRLSELTPADRAAARADRRAAKAAKRRAERLAKEVEESRVALEAYLKEGIGSHQRKLRASSTVVVGDEAGALMKAAGLRNGLRSRMPPIPGLVADAQAVALPFGRGPVDFTITLRKPAYTTEHHELYAKFNMALHRGRPRDNTQHSFTRHLVTSPILPMEPSRMGFLHACSCDAVQDWDARVRAGQPGADDTPFVVLSMERRLVKLADDLGMDALAPDEDGLTSQVLASMGFEDGSVAFALDLLRRLTARRAVFGGDAVADVPDAGGTVGVLPVIALPRAFLHLLLQFDLLCGHYKMAKGTVLMAVVRLLEQVLEAADALLALRPVMPAPATIPAAADIPSFPGNEASAVAELSDASAAQAFSQHQAQLEAYELKRAEFLSTLQLEGLFERVQDVMEQTASTLIWFDSAVASTLRSANQLVDSFAPANVHVPAQPQAKVSGLAALEPFFDREAGRDGDGRAAAGRIHVGGWDLSMGFGSFFHEYRLNDVLVAVSVLDILPTRVASVYFFYDPELRYLELGKLSALVEIWLTQQIHEHTRAHPEVLGLPAGLGPLCRWWDANFYVHMCETMSYKRQFRPSQLLCPVYKRNAWVDLTDEVLRKLDLDPAAPLATVKLPDVAGGIVETSEPHIVRALAKALDRDEAVRATRAVPHVAVMLGPRIYTMRQLSASSQALLLRGYAAYTRLMTVPLAMRSVTDPNWVAGLATQERDEQAERVARAAMRAAKIAAAQQAGETAAQDEARGAAGEGAAHSPSQAAAGTDAGGEDDATPPIATGPSPPAPAAEAEQ